MIIPDASKCFRRRAFTLIEMIVLLVIMAVMAAIIAPKMGNFYQNVKLTSTVRRFRLFIDAARSNAMQSHGVSRLTIQPGWRKIHIETQKKKIISNPHEAVEYIKKVENQDSVSHSDKDKLPEFVRMEGDFSEMIIPDGVEINYISVSGKRKASIQKVVITFKSFHQFDEVDFSFKNKLNEYQGLRLEAGSGMVRDLQIIKQN